VHRETLASQLCGEAATWNSPTRASSSRRAAAAACAVVRWLNGADVADGPWAAGANPRQALHCALTTVDGRHGYSCACVCLCLATGGEVERNPNPTTAQRQCWPDDSSHRRVVQTRVQLTACHYCRHGAQAHVAMRAVRAVRQSAATETRARRAVKKARAQLQSVPVFPHPLCLSVCVSGRPWLWLRAWCGAAGRKGSRRAVA
jgi:hypothetical protein